MGFLNSLFGTESTNFKKIDRPTFIKEFTKESSNIAALEELAEKVKNEDKKEQITKEISLMKMGLNGEGNVAYELKNCTFPMLCLHDIRIEYDNLTAQIDFIVITKKYICVLETKQLQGDVNINSDGEFIRVYKAKNGFETKTGMYSPIEQNRKHINLLKKIIKDEFGFDHVPIKSLVVMANPKAIIKKKYASNEIQEQIIRAEKLGEYLNELMKNIDNVSLKEDTAFKIANFLKDKHKPIDIDYKAKFGLSEIDFADENKVIDSVKESKINNNLNEKSNIESNNQILNEEDKKLEEALKKYRNAKAKEKGLEYIKYNYIFSNAVISNLVNDKPKTTSELYKIKGLGEAKIGTYGSDILNIICEENKEKTINKEIIKQTTTSDDELREMLKKYRSETSRSENVKPYFIFNNEQMEDIIRLKPQSKQELLKIKGFGEVKVTKYGDEIIGILKR